MALIELDSGETVEELSSSELLQVTGAFVQRLFDAMSIAGCNDVLPDEFPKSVCARFKSDTDVLSAWRLALTRKI